MLLHSYIYLCMYRPGKGRRMRKTRGMMSPPPTPLV